MNHKRNQKRNKNTLETKENVNTTYQNLWDTAKAVLSGKFIAVTLLQKLRRYQISNSQCISRTRKTEIKQTQNLEEERNNKIRKEISKIKVKKLQKSNEIKS